jgi:hypothetical protein
MEGKGEVVINPMIQPLSWLVGRWSSKDGVGYYPTISNDFRYNDVMEFGLCGAQPLLSYSSSTTHPEKGNLMHLESGFLRSRGPGLVSFMVAHNFGKYTKNMPVLFAIQILVEF